MRTGLGLTPPFDIPRPVEELFGVVKQVEEDGFSSVWAPSLPSVGPPDALVLLGALSRMTSRIELGSYVVPPFRDIRRRLRSRHSPSSSSARTGSRLASGSATSRLSKPASASIIRTRSAICVSTCRC